MKLDLREDKYGKTKGIKNVRKASDEVLRDTIDTNSKSTSGQFSIVLNTISSNSTC